MFLNPNIGPKHFSSELNRNRKSAYTSHTATAEIIDNPKDKGCKNIQINLKSENGVLHEIKISDDCPGGLQGLTLEGVLNPGNLGYKNTDHDISEYISENGIGGKAAAQNLANNCRYFTYDKSVNSYIFAENNFKIMSKTIDVTRSYDFTDLKCIDESRYQEIHPFTEGTSVVLSDLQPMAMNLYNITEFESYLLHTYGKTNINISIIVDGVPRSLPEFRSPVSHSSSTRNTIIHKITILKPCSPEYELEFLIQRTKGNQQISYFNANIINGKLDLKVLKYKKEYTALLNALLNNPNYIQYTAVLKSTSTYLTDYLDENGCKKFSRGYISTYFNDRCLGQNTFDPSAENDGYANHIHNELYIYDKDVCKMLGVSFFKTLSNTHHSPLTELLGCLQRKVRGKTMLHKQALEKEYRKQTNIASKKLHIITEQEDIVDVHTEQVVKPDTEQEDIIDVHTEQEDIIDVHTEQVVKPDTEQEDIVDVHTEQVVKPDTESGAEAEEVKHVVLPVYAVQQLESLLTKAKYDKLPDNWFLCESQKILRDVFKSMIE